MTIGGIQKFSTVDYPGYTVASIFTIGCNMRCGYCHNPELVLPEQYAGAIPEEEIFEFLEKRRGLLDGVAISGGEPTMQEDLPDFIRRCKKMGFLVKLDTNGTNPGVLRELLQENLVDFVAMDIKGPLEKYSQIAARPIDIDAILESIDLIRTVPHEFRTTIVRGQLVPEDFESIGQLVHGADRFALQYFVPGTTVSPQFNKRESFTKQEMDQARDIMSRHVQECVVH
ncbi:anaerobic ribonucleoside-triphosphate reductase activating protein [Candidatus Saccharibacteria bacterium oral taxon 955]|jgi:anaerobic ribonucleoside-triphosphate reductase activating protein|nr:anaerobic ribonucleoside-triphosphate reductase activating protein [Candidatus Saccharibacteria bacterium oral taxon 955]QJU05975.1 anaerobic ribonucleoside-triphosphate reductase activating protein [Candidatus Saccharibacteria bacterium oral taxon 955]